MEFDDFDNFETVPILYYDPLSSHARSCQMLLKMLKINVDLQPTDSMDDINFNETYTWINSFCKLPTLVDGGITLCNGHSILIYLCRKYTATNLPNLCPCDYITRQKITSILFYEGCILYRCFSHLMADIILAKFPNFNVEYHKRKVSDVYNSLNAFLNGHSFIIGNHITIGDISIVSTVSALNIIFPIESNKFPKLFDWFQRLKKMEFYNCNDEGIQKLRYILKNVAKFPFPTPLTIDTDYSQFATNNNEIQRKKSNETSSELRNKNEDEKSNTTDIENLNQRNESLEKTSGIVIGTKKDKTKHEFETFNFYDNYFINVSKCNCSSCTEPKNIANSQQDDFSKGSGEEDDFKETSQIYKRPQTVANSTSREDILKEPLQRDLSQLPANKIKERVQQIACICSCGQELCKTKRNELLENRFKRANRLKRATPKSSTQNENQDNVKRMASKENDSSNTISSEDTDGGYTKQHQVIKTKYKKTCKCKDKQNKKLDKAKDRDNNIKESEIIKTDNEISNDINDSAKSNEEMISDSMRNNEQNLLTNQEVQDLIAKVRKLEKILETSDKVLKNSNSILSTTVSANSSVDSITKRFPQDCGPPSSSFQQKSHPWECRSKQKISGHICRGASRIEALDFDEVTHVVMPEFLVRNLEKLECCATSTSTKVDAEEQSDRLEGGSNRNHCVCESFVKVFPMATENLNKTNKDYEKNLPDAEKKLDTIMYWLCTKSSCKNETHCDDCCKQ